MADADDEAEPGPLRRAYDVVTPGYAPRPDAEMSAVGWTLLAGMVLLVLPFLPLLLVVWLVSRLLERVAGE